VFGYMVTVRYFSISGASVDLLASTADSMFDWELPDLPEDWALLRSDMTPWFESVVHEEWAALLLTEAEIAQLASDAPSWSEVLADPRPHP